MVKRHEDKEDKAQYLRLLSPKVWEDLFRLNFFFGGGGGGGWGGVYMGSNSRSCKEGGKVSHMHFPVI